MDFNILIVVLFPIIFVLVVLVAFYLIASKLIDRWKRK